METKRHHISKRSYQVVERLSIKMKKVLTSLVLLFAFLCSSYAQNKQEESTVIQMNRQMFLDKVFDYTTGATEWKYKGEKPAVIDFYATWCGPCRMIAPILKDLAKEYGDSIVIYKIDTDKEKELSGAMGIQSLPTIVFIPKSGQPQVIIGAADKATFRRAIDEVLLNKK
jgi:thioredoxin